MGPAAVSSCVQVQLTRALRHVLTKPVWWKRCRSGGGNANLGNNIKATLLPGSMDTGVTVYVSKGGYTKSKQLDVYGLENWHIIKDIRHVNPNPPRKTISMKVGANKIDLPPEQYAQQIVKQYTGNV